MFIWWILIFGIIFSLQMYLNFSMVKLHPDLFDPIFYIVACLNFLLFAVSSTVLFGFLGIVIGAIFLILYHISVGWLIIFPLYKYAYRFEYSEEFEPFYWVYIYIIVIIASILFTVYVCVTKQWKAGLYFYTNLSTEVKTVLWILGFILFLVRDAYAKKLKKFRTEARINMTKHFN